MPEYCTCGAQLPPDALFCHKCGKPQRELIEPEIEANTYPAAMAAVAPPAPPPRPEPLPLNFHNAIAVRIALVVAMGATVLMFLPYINWFAAGYFAVFFYRRRTGCLLNVESGVRMGWMTGIMMFAMFAFLLTTSMIAIRAIGGIAALPAEFKNAVDPKTLESLKVLLNGPAAAEMLVQVFFFVTCLSMVGGALGAKMVGSRKPGV
jgi:hypothetical protein